MVFALSLCVSISVGIYYGFIGKNQTTRDEYLMAGRNMKILPVSVSLFLSWFSAISFIGDPIEVYYHGSIYWATGIGYVLGCVPVAMYFAPTFHRMNIVSCFEVSTLRMEERKKDRKKKEKDRNIMSGIRIVFAFIHAHVA